MTKQSDDFAKGNSAVLTRATEEQRVLLAAMAIETLQGMHALGELKFPQPWTDTDGSLIQSWDPRRDGDELACWLDILGLNDRPMKDSANEKRRQRMAMAD